MAVVPGYVDPLHAVEHFDEASDAFARDTPPSREEVLAVNGPWSWSGINEQLWTKYFRARARLYEAIRDPIKVKELLSRAVTCLEDSKAGWHSSEVSRFRVLVETLYKVVSDPSSLSAEDARKEYLFEVRLSGDSKEDRFALTFISEVTRALRGFEADPTSELTKNGLAAAVDALARIPIIGPDVAKAIRPAIGKSAFRTMLGPIQTWMHSALESIADERKFRAILLRLLQAGLPLYAQVLHGPIEYGKDIATLVEGSDAVVLRFYQVKCGDIDKKKWRESKDELEEMFAVPLDSLHLPIAPTHIEGVFVTNGHANPYVAPGIGAWLREQRERLGHNIEFMHLDSLVDWITESRLINELRLALAEQGIVTQKHT